MNALTGEIAVARRHAHSASPGRNRRPRGERSANDLLTGAIALVVERKAKMVIRPQMNVKEARGVASNNAVNPLVGDEA